MKKLVVLISSIVAILGVWGLLAFEMGSVTDLKALMPALVPFEDQRDSVAEATGWLVRTQQNPDGGYGIDFGTGNPLSNVGATLDAVLAIGAAGYNPAASAFGQSSTPVAYLALQATELMTFTTTSGGSAGKVILALTAANQNPRSFAGQDWVTVLTDQLNGDGSYNNGTAFNQSLSILALTAVNESTPANALTWLTDLQAVDGSWDDGFGTLQNPDATGVAIMALLAAGVPATDPAIDNAQAFLAAAQLPDGGWEYGVGFGSNANSTALALQALSALGEDFYSPASPWKKGDTTPLLALLAFQNDTGAFQFFGADDFFATVQALPAATGKFYPLPSRSEAAQLALTCLETLQDPATGGWEQFAGVGVNAGGTSRAIQAIAAMGENPQDARWQPAAIGAVDGLIAQTPDYLSTGRGGRVGTIMQGVIAAGAPHDVTNFAGFNLPISMSNYLSPTGEYAKTGFGTFPHSEAMLGLQVAGLMPDETAVDFLLNAHTNGDWGGADTTGIALNVLGRMGIHVPGSIEGLRANQAADGGWGFGGSSSPGSISEVVQGLVQSGENPFSPGWSIVINGVVTNPADTIINQQQTNGCWPNLFGPGDDPFSTTDGIVLLAQEAGWEVYDLYLPIVVR